VSQPASGAARPALSRFLGRGPRAAAALLLAACASGSPPESLTPGAARAEAAARPDDARAREWEDYGGSPDQSRFVALSRIDRDNVDELEVAWFYPTGDGNVYQFNPIVVDGVMYVLAKESSLVALDATTGEEIWIHANLRGIARRGINYWESEDGSDRRLIFQINDYLQAIDARTGRSILTFGDSGLVDLRQGLGRDPASLNRVQSGTPGKIFENLILLGSAPGEGYLSAPGHIRAFDVVTGRLVWTFHTIPQPGEFGYETWPPEAYRYAGGANTWGEMSIDEERGIAYFPTGSPTYDYYGADRPGSNLFGNSLLALDARTGERLWHFQMVHHDLWDYDAAAAPQLVTVRRNGRETDAVAVATKHGFLFAFDRVTGEPLWPIEERPVPPSEVPGEQAWPTQPFPTVLPPFARQSMTADDITPYFLDDEERTEWRERVDSLGRAGRTGLFTPLSHRQETLAVPGAVGGASWGNTASDPDAGLVYVYSIDWPSFYPVLEKREEEGAGAGGAARPGSAPANPIQQGRALYEQTCQACHGENRAGVGTAPSLVGLERRFSVDDFRALLASGRGEMPAFPQLGDEEVRALYRYLGGSASGAVAREPEGPVVQVGGAPGGLELRRAPGGGGGRVGAPYPEGVGAPADRYFIQGWGLGFAHVISPPWASITAYDLNNGTIRWRRPVGTDLEAAAEGGKDTGVPEAQRNGMIVTSTGLLFSTAKDGHVYAFDAADGRELWRAKLPTGTEGIPAMYEVDGRQYLVVTATTPLQWGRGSDPAAGPPQPLGGYVVFSLPDDR
jgi:quinoprotein glucose dehydrogenase